MKRGFLLVFGTLLLVSTGALAQGTQADYERANALARRVTGKTVRASVKPNWIGQQGRFWYSNDLGEGRREFWLVDPAAPSRRPAFDAVRLAATLTKTLGRKVDAAHLPIDTIALADDKPLLTLAVGGKTYVCALQTYELREESKENKESTTISKATGLTLEDAPKASRPRPTPPSDPALSPDGKWRAFVRGHNVVLQEAQNGQETPLTQDGSPADGYEWRPYWSPDSTHFVMVRYARGQEHKVYLVESSPKDQLQPKLHTLDYLKPGDDIGRTRPHLFDVAAKRLVPIKEDLSPTPYNLDLFNIRWEADSKRFTFLYNQRGHQVMRVIGVNAGTGEAKTVIDEQAKTFIDWTNKVFLHPLDTNREAIWMSERDGWNHLYLYDTDTGQVKNQITKGAWVVRGVERVDETKRQIWFRASGIYPQQDPYYIHYARVNFDGSGLTLLTDGDGTHNLTYAPDGQTFLDAYSRVDMPPVTELRRASDGKKLLALEKGDASALLATDWKYPERFVAKGRDDKTDIYGVIVRPSIFDPKRKYPVLENIYAGPQGSFVPKAFSPANGLQAMAELGFIVVQIDGMGTNNRSKAFHDVCWKNLGDAGFPDRIKWIKAASSKYPAMDLSRVGIYGTSAGGQNALGGLLLHGDFYKAGVADCGCHDNRMDKLWWNEQWMGWPLTPHYAEQSNVTLAPRLQGKLLLMVGEMDTNVDPASTMQVVNALIKADKDSSCW